MNLKSKYIYCSVEQFCAMWSSFVQCWAIVCNVEQFWAILCSFVQCWAVLCSVEQLCAMLSSFEQYYAVLCNVEQFWVQFLCSVERFCAVLCSFEHFNACLKWNKRFSIFFSDNLFLRLEAYQGARSSPPPLKRKSVNIIVLIFKRSNRTEFCTINWMHSYPDVA